MIVYQEDTVRLEDLKHYRYNSTDRSVLSNFLLKHYWNWIMRFVPLSVAPNLITIIGGFAMLLSFLATVMLDPTLSEAKSRYLHLLNAFLLFFYSTMDNIDGKQAVRTSTTSPLGQLMDHGVDSLVSTFIVVALASSIGLGLGTDLVFLLFFVYFPFYYTTLYERFTQRMVFNPIDGPSEGIIFCIFVHVMAFFFGQEAFSGIHKRNVSTLLGVSSRMDLDISDLSIFISVFLVGNTSYFITNLTSFIGKVHVFLIFRRILIMFGLFMSMLLFSMTEAFRIRTFSYLSILVTMFLFSYINIDVVYSRLRNTELPTIPEVYVLFIAFCFIYTCEPSLRLLKSYMFFLFVFVSIAYVLRICSIFSMVKDFLDISLFKIDAKKKS